MKTILLQCFLLGLSLTGSCPGQMSAAEDWARTGHDCHLFAVANVDADGFDDLITINKNKHLAAALTVEGQKASKWRTLAQNMPDAPLALIGMDLLAEPRGDEAIVVTTQSVIIFHGYAAGTLEHRIQYDAPPGVEFAAASVNGDSLLLRDTNGQSWKLTDGSFIATQEHDSGNAPHTIDPPPFEPDAPSRMSFTGDLNGDGLLDHIAAFEATKPNNHMAIRVAFALNRAANDQDGDGLLDEDERRIGSDPQDRDTDDDGLLDGWEVHGLPRAIDGPDTPLSPIRQDVIVAVRIYEGVDEDKAKKSIERSKGLYARLPNTNPDGSTGITLHYRFDGLVPKDDQGHWHDVATKHFPAAHRGLMHWMQVTGLGGGGQAQQLGDEGSAGANWAAFGHEIGHQLGLSHTGDSRPVWCPLYPSLMNYAFNYNLGGDSNAIRFSDGRFADVSLSESSLSEHLPIKFHELTYLSKGPFYFSLEDDGNSGTRIDWNHNGRFDEGPVTADINYGSSTNCGTRRKSGFLGAGPALTRIGDQMVMATLNQAQDAISLRFYEGQEKWSQPRPVPQSDSDTQPVLVGTQSSGYLLFRRQGTWNILNFDANQIGPAYALPVHAEQLSAGLVDERILIIGKHADETLSTWWLDPRDNDSSNHFALVPGPRLGTMSAVPVAFDIDPQTNQLVLATAGIPIGSKKQSLRMSWYSLIDQQLVLDETRWVGGSKGGVACSTRPTVRVTDQGELYIFHTGTPRADGQMIAYRTKQIANRDLRDGWLVSMLYDIWTRTLCPVAFESSPQGAVYAFRWDAGDHAYKVNELLLCHNGLGIDAEPMRDHDDAALITRWGIRHSILYLKRQP